MCAINCPFDYCKPYDIHVNLEYPDSQCAFNRTGTLCGSFEPGLSLMLGSSLCCQCSDKYVALIIPFVISGFVLIFFIKVLNLTVSQGTINGLIFFANVVWANQDIFFPPGDRNVLTVFIAWLNLDIGIEICFFNGLDTYHNTWIQFNFIWVIIVLIVIVCRYSSIATKVLGSNAVPVIATLILLSYAKLLHTIITALSLAVLQLPDGDKLSVWLYDGNIQYLNGKYIPLFVFALMVFLFLWLPYTIILLFGQCIQRMTNHRFRRWVLRLKPFLDAYAAPFKDEHRYWVGILLVTRAFLTILLAFNVLGDPQTSMFVVIIIAIVLLVI